MNTREEPKDNFIRDVLFACVCGIVCGGVGLVFYWATSIADSTRQDNPWLLYFLPLSGLIVVFLYDKLLEKEELTINSLFHFARREKPVSPWLSPMIFISTCLGYLTGGSLGRAGSALQIGGGLAALLRDVSRLRVSSDICFSCGISAGFTAIMGSPLAGTVFGVELLLLRKGSLFPLIYSGISSYITWGMSKLFRVEYISFATEFGEKVSVSLLIRVLILALFISLVARLYCLCRKYVALALTRIPQVYVRVLIGTAAVIVVTKFIGHTNCNGIGFTVVSEALNGSCESSYWIFKLLLTVLTLGCGIRGGEIAPNVFIGATFGFAIGPIIGLDPVMAAALGLVGNLSAVTNCSLAIFIMGIELINASPLGIGCFALTNLIVHFASGKVGIYNNRGKLHE